MQVAAGFDHRGCHLREAVLGAIAAAGHDALDLGVDTDAVRVDYPDIAQNIGAASRDGRAERGVFVCGSGVGASVAACKIPGIRAAICHDAYSAHQGVEHDDMNVLCLGSEIVGRRWRATWSSGSSPRRSSARAAICHGWRRSPSWNGSATAESEGRTWRHRSCTS